MQVKDAPETSRWWREWELGLLVLLVIATYFSRLTALPVRGEESRWACVAVQMIELGDWLIPRQQGQPYIDRPPLAQWAMALVGLVRGEVDLVAIRLPSVTAVLLTTVLIYAYARTALSRLGALSAAAAFATAGQVLQIGRLGENEALYTLVVASSLLLWHWGYVRAWPRWAPWVLGYSFAALGMLIKGPQAPVYFVAAVGLFLLLRREWKWIFSWQHAVGICSFAGIFLLWAVPFYLATDWESTIGMFTRTSAVRYKSSGLIKHLLEYPLETFGCLLPWSPLLLGLVRPKIRRELGSVPPHVLFLVTAILVTYPSVWLAAGARGRYFMPLYPCIAVLIGWVLERVATRGRAQAARRSWELYLVVLAFLVGLGGCALLAASTLPVSAFAPLAQPLWFALLVAAVAAAAAAVLLRARLTTDAGTAKSAVFAVVSFAGLVFTGAVVNSWLREANDLTVTVTELKTQLPDSVRLVSFGPIDHRFAFYYETLIPELQWPTSREELPEDVSYFCYEHHRGDTAESRVNGRGMYWTRTPGTLPFEWEQVASIPCDRTHTDDPEITAVIGRIVRPAMATAEALNRIR